MRIHIVWHRRDLRLDDNPLYSSREWAGEATPSSEQQPLWLAPVYVHDASSTAAVHSTVKSDDNIHVQHAGPFAARFLAESVAALREALQAVGSGSQLYIRHGVEPGAVLQAFALELRQAATAAATSCSVTSSGSAPPLTITAGWHYIPGTFEAAAEASVKAALEAVGVQCRPPLWSCTLWHPADLPYGERGWGTVPAAVRRQARKGKGRSKGKGKGKGKDYWQQWQRQQKQQEQEQKSGHAAGGSSPPTALAAASSADSADATSTLQSLETHPPSGPPQPAEPRPQADGDSPTSSLRATAPSRWVGLPRTMNQFRRVASAPNAAPIHPPTKRPTSLPPPVPLDLMQCGNLEDMITLLQSPPSVPLFGFTLDEVAAVYRQAWSVEGADSRSAHPLQGGEAAGLARLAAFIASSSATATTQACEAASCEGGGAAPAHVVTAATTPVTAGSAATATTVAAAAADARTAPAAHSTSPPEKANASETKNQTPHPGKGKGKGKGRSKLPRGGPVKPGGAGGGAGGGLNSSAKLAAYLSFGCLSPRTIFAACNADTAVDARWVTTHLQIRDWFIISSIAEGVQLYKRDRRHPRNPTGLDGGGDGGGDGESADTRGGGAFPTLPEDHWQPFHLQTWRRWARGATGLPLIDAGMRELRATGYLSNRCRQNCASVLAKDLKLDWRCGAEYFQWLLIDHDLGSNWGNWRYFSGVGNDPKQRHFCSISQGMKYDADATFIKMWLPALAAFSPKEAHLSPFRADGSSHVADSGEAGGVDAGDAEAGQQLEPERQLLPTLPALLDPFTQLTWMDKQEIFPETCAVPLP